MIDLHCHFLPGIDDGAQTLADGLALAQAAVADGITYSVMTPHIHPGRYENTRSTIEKAFKDFRLALRKARVALHIGMAAEVRLSPDIVALLRCNEVPFLGELDGHRIILLEFPHTQITPGADKLVERLLQHNIRPLIAHPERNQDVIRDLSKIAPFIEMGCFLQITAGALLGDFGRAPPRRALQLLALPAFQVLPPPAHHLTGRRPVLPGGLEARSGGVGPPGAHDPVNRNPRIILRGAVAAVA